MKEELVSFELARLAQSKGFHHMKSNCYGDSMCYQLPEGDLTNALKGNIVLGYILAPTQSLLQKWLREEHKIHTNVFPVFEFRVQGWTFKMASIFVNPEDKSLPLLQENPFLNTYEEALEVSLIEALKLIK